MQPGAPGLRFPVRVDRTWLKADLDNATAAGREALASSLAGFRKSGVPADRLKACDPDGRDGTKLRGCVKVYLPPPLGPWGCCLHRRNFRRRQGPNTGPPRGGRTPSQQALAAERLRSCPPTFARTRRERLSQRNSASDPNPAFAGDLADSERQDLRDHPELEGAVELVAGTIETPDHTEPDPRIGRHRTTGDR